MNKFSFAVRFCVAFMIFAPLFANAILYMLGHPAFDLKPILVVLVFAGFSGWLLGMVKAEDSIIH